MDRGTFLALGALGAGGHPRARGLKPRLPILPLTYVLPIRRAREPAPEELNAYLRRLSRFAEVVVVDGSPPEVFGRHAETWRGLARHVPPDPDLTCLHGKVAGVITGVRMAAHERVVVADDDARYDEAGLARMVRLLDDADLVVPQNYFDPLPWHARWDTARTLLNRATGRDFPGTLGVRRSFFIGMGGYDGDVLFENMELMRTVDAAGGTIFAPLDFFVLRLPPTTRHFLSQRVRQAYDELARPGRMALSLGILPALAGLLARVGRGRGIRDALVVLVAFAAVAVATAEGGRRRSSGREVFPASASLLAPAWLVERGVCAWLALGSRLLFGGCRYAGALIPRAATPERELRRRFDRGVPPLPPSLGSR